MALVFLDTSAIIKNYVPEVGSQWVRTLVNGNSVAISLLTIAEIASALGRRTREGGLVTRQRDAIFRQVLTDLEGFVVIRLSQTIVADAARLALSIPSPLTVRAADALQLACAKRCFQRAKHGGVPAGSFVTADRGLMAVAQWVELSVDNPVDHP